MGAAHLNEVVAVAQNNALASAGECLSNDKLLALFNDIDRAGVLVTDASEHILVFVEGELFVYLIASMQLVVKVRGFREQRLHTDHLGVAAQRTVVARETRATKSIARTQVPKIMRQTQFQSLGGGRICSLLAHTGVRANSIEDVVLAGTRGAVGNVADHVGVGHL